MAAACRSVLTASCAGGFQECAACLVFARYNVTAERCPEGTGKVKYFEGTPIPHVH
jgi:phosphatidylserine synthase